MLNKQTSEHSTDKVSLSQSENSLVIYKKKGMQSSSVKKFLKRLSILFKLYPNMKETLNSCL